MMQGVMDGWWDAMAIAWSDAWAGGGLGPTALAAASLLVWAYLLLLHGRFWQAGPVLAPAAPTARPGDAPAVDVVIPARDEAEGIEAAVRSLLAQEGLGRLRVVVVDDRSTDGTGSILRGITDSRLHVLDGQPRPEGWSGKLWAAHQGLAWTERHDPAPLVLLTDADILHHPAHLATLAAKQRAERLDLVSEMVELRCRSFAERLLVPAFVYFFQMLYPFAWVNRRDKRLAAAAGGTVLLRRAALERIGGLPAMRGALIDDVTLAAKVKGSGGGVYLGHSALARSIRPYPGAGDVWRMVARTAYVQLRYSPVILLGTVAGLALVWLAPPLVGLFGHGAARWMARAAWLGAMASYLPTLRRFGLGPGWALLLPGIAGFYMAATVGSAVDHHRGRGVQWKRRSYIDPLPFTGEGGTHAVRHGRVRESTGATLVRREAPSPQPSPASGRGS